MTPKEKAKELVDKFYDYADSNYGATKFEKKWYGNVLAGERKVRKQSAKQCALIAVDEIINSNPKIILKWAFSGIKEFDSISYWQEVKKEIENL